jgi:hypothetical protein
MIVYETREKHFPAKIGGFIMDDQNQSPTSPQSPPAPTQDPATAIPVVSEDVDLAVPDKQLGAWIRRFLACNPWYLLSAALLLYSFYLISADRSFLTSEVSQLSFNLGSLQLYEALVVVTAIFLARRAIWYDSTLLVGLESLLVLVPFILISQAALINERLVWVLCTAAALLAATRLGLLKRFIAQLNIPPGLLVAGTIMLAVNAALPVVYRVLHETTMGKRPDFGTGFETNQYVWWLAIPALCGLSNLVRVKPTENELWLQRWWLPLGLFALWLAGTGVHLYCLDYVYEFQLRPDMVAPAVWALCWSLYFGVGRALPNLSRAWKNALSVLPLLTTLTATSQPGNGVFLILTALNVAIYALICFRMRTSMALHCLLISAVAFLAGLPEEWARTLAPQFSRERFLAIALMVYVLVRLALTRNPKAGFLGGLVAATTVALWNPNALHWAAQSGLVFLLLHSFRWDDSKEQGTAAVRWLAASVWVGHSVFWSHFDGGGWSVCALAGPVLAVCLIFRWLRRGWGPVAVPLAASVVLLSAPGHAAAAHLQSAPAGLLAVAGSFALFGLGTLGALTKHRWARR